MDDKALKKYLEEMKTVVIVGASNKVERASNGIMKYLMKNGYECYPVNPLEEKVLGVKSYKSVKDVPVKPDLVDIFRKSEATPPIVREAVEKRAGFIWMQEEVANEESRKIAEEAGIPYIEDKCLFKEMLRLRVKL
jgi:predicted CoA-binding protein